MTILDLLATILFLFILLANLRRHHQRYAEQKFRYELFTLRDKLRRLAIEGKIDCESKLFDFFDLTLSKAINEYYYITLIRLIVLNRKHSEDTKYKKAYDNLMKDCDSNKESKYIKNQYERVVTEYVIKQHYVSYRFFKPVIMFFSAATIVKRKFREIIHSVAYLPETSATDKLVSSPHRVVIPN